MKACLTNFLSSSEPRQAALPATAWSPAVNVYSSPVIAAAPTAGPDPALLAHTAQVAAQDTAAGSVANRIRGVLQSTYGAEWHLLSAAAFLLMIVPLLVFFSLQRYFVRGLTAGSVKG